MTDTPPKVAILGFHLESNGSSPVSSMQDFLDQCWEVGDDISARAREHSRLPTEINGFYARMDELGPWEPLPLIIVGAPPGGPASKEVWDVFMEEVDKRLSAVLPVDAIYVGNHGASAAEHENDTEAVLLKRLRDMTGPDTPIVVSYDLHCNISPDAIDNLDALVTYRTNPHIDQRERGAETADLLHEILNGMNPVTAYIRLPLTAPTITLLTDDGPYGDIIKKGVKLMQSPAEGPIANVSIASGFVFSDLPKCGMTITVTARNDLVAARRVALQLAREAWADRARYIPNTISIQEAVDTACSADLPLLFADVADNPGGGAKGNTSTLMQALVNAQVKGVVMGVYIDAALAQEAHNLGEGAEFEAVFDRDGTSEYSLPYRTRATVLKLTDGEEVGRRGLFAGQKFSLGLTALLRLDGSGLRVVVGSFRRQLIDPVMLEMHGINIAQERLIVVKSRGHYRAGFDEFFSKEQIFDVDSPGMTTPDLARITFKHLPRPVWPLDPETQWIEPTWADSVTTQE